MIEILLVCVFVLARTCLLGLKLLGVFGGNVCSWDYEVILDING